MKFLATINIMPHKELLDPQGKTVKKNLNSIDVTGVDDVRIGKHIEMKFDANNESDAKEKVEIVCKKMFANLIMETYDYKITGLN